MITHCNHASSSRLLICGLEEESNVYLCHLKSLEIAVIKF